MNITVPPESSRINHDLYKSMTPRRSTFSETMVRRRSPFLRSENTPNTGKLLKLATNTSRSSYKRPLSTENKENLPESPCKCHSSVHATTRKINSNDGSKSGHSKLNQSSKVVEHCQQIRASITGNETSLKIRNPLNFPDNGMNESADVIETSYNSESETENWLNIQHDIKQLKKRRENLKLKRGQNDTSLTNHCSLKENPHRSQTFYQTPDHIKSLDNETKQELLNKSLTEIETSNCHSTQISGYYSQASITQSNANLETSLENCLNHLEENIKPLTNSTFICQTETIGNETNEYQTASELTKEENVNETYLLENTNESVTDKPIKSKDSFPKQYPLYQPQNFQIPLIIINEIEIINHGLRETATIESQTFKTLKVPAIHIRSDFEENKELQKKLNEMEHFKQIVIKDKVMAQLLEIAISIDFPPLKHLCNVLCEKTEDGCCLKMKVEAEKKTKKDEHSGFFHNFWCAIKYPFVAIHNKTEEKGDYNLNKAVVKEKGSKEEVKDEVQPKDIKDNKEEGETSKHDEKKGKPEVTNCEESSDNNGNKKVIKMDDKKGHELEKVEDNMQKTVQESNNIGKLETKDLEKNTDIKHNTEELKHEAKESKETNNDTKGGIKILAKDKTKDHLANENEHRKSSNEAINSKEAENRINESDKKDLVATETENKTKPEADNISESKTNKSNAQHTPKVESNNKPPKEQETKKKTKSKKRFLFFFQKSEKSKTDPKEAALDESQQIEDMEEKLQELERAELQLSQEALKKLDNFMVEKCQFQSTESKARSKRSDSF